MSDLGGCPSCGKGKLKGAIHACDNAECGDWYVGGRGAEILDEQRALARREGYAAGVEAARRIVAAYPEVPDRVLMHIDRERRALDAGDATRCAECGSATCEGTHAKDPYAHMIVRGDAGNAPCPPHDFRDGTCSRCGDEVITVTDAGDATCGDDDCPDCNDGILTRAFAEPHDIPCPTCNGTMKRPPPGDAHGEGGA